MEFSFQNSKLFSFCRRTFKVKTNVSLVDIKKKKKKSEQPYNLSLKKNLPQICIIFVIILEAYTLSSRKEKIWRSIYLIFFQEKKTHITIHGISASLFFPFLLFPTSNFKKKWRSPADKENNGEKIESKEYSLVDH